MTCPDAIKCNGRAPSAADSIFRPERTTLVGIPAPAKSLAPAPGNLSSRHQANTYQVMG